MAREKIYLARGIHCCPSRVVYIIRPASLYYEGNICVYTHIWLHADCIRITAATKQHCSETFLHKSGALRSVDCICIIGVPVGRWLGEYVTLDKSFTNPCQTGSNSSPSYWHIFFLIAFLEQAFFFRNIIIMLYTNYIILMCISNNAVINNH